MTNAKQIRSMTDEDMAEHFNEWFGCPPEVYDKNECPSHDTCADCWVAWLQKEIEEDENARD